MKPAALPLAFTLCTAILTGCGAGSPACVTGSSLDVSPATATADSTAKIPGNQQQFKASSQPISLKGNCALPAFIAIVHPNWTNPDPIHIAISSANDDTNGLATCKGPTAGPVTLTAGPVSLTAGPVSPTAQPTTPPTATVQLTCR